jgi:hypothetical protein
MAKVQTIAISMGRKVSENYCTREASYTISLELAEGEDPGEVLQTWTDQLQDTVDECLGDPGARVSFAGARQRGAELREGREA